MPPKKKKKTREETIAEEYFPVDKEDLEFAVEKPEKANIVRDDFLKQAVEKLEKKPLPKEEIIKGSIEKPYKKPGKSIIETVETIPKKTRKRKKYSKKKTTKKKSKSTTSKTLKKEYKIPRIDLKEDGYELIITEKPQAALKIASALGKSTKRANRGIPYYEVSRDGKEIIVACAVGHLFTLQQNIAGSSVPIFDIGWVPNYLARKKDFTKKYYDTILTLAKGAGSVTIATDYDIEGEVIGLNIMRYILNQKDANRMKFSTLTNPELNKAYDEKLKNINWGHAIAGETRHYLDWFYGINLSRALMNAIKTTGQFRIMSIGRVQGPALNLVVQKERQIKAFKPEPYWQIFITVKNGHELELKHNKDIFDKKELEKFKDLVGKTAKTETKKTEQILSPNPPFNLTNLQTEAYRFHGITPSNTLKAAQSLYLAGIISYPRTSSQKLPDSVGYKDILKKLAKKYNVEQLITKNKPIEGTKSDPAHPSIYPTGESQILSGHEEKIYELIVRRFLSLFCDDAIIDNKRVTAKTNDLLFSAKGSSIRKKAWMEIYPIKLKEQEIPDLEGDVKIIDSKIEEKETQPPKRYSPASIISELEKRNLGTKCLTGDTKIIINNQPIKIEEIFSKAKKHSREKNKEIRKIALKTISLNKDEKILITEPQFISKRRINNDEKVIEIKSDLSKINLTEEHIVYIHKNNKIRQITVKNLRISDKLLGLIKPYKEGKEIITENIFNEKYKIKEREIKHKFASQNHKGIIKAKFPIKWSTSLAWILGYYYGDGSYDGPKYNGSHSISFSTTEKKALDLLKKASKNIFGRSCYAYDLGSKYKVDLNSVMSYVLIKTFPELDGKNPINVPQEFIGDFLRGFYDADGNVHLRPKRKTMIKGILCNSYDTPRIKMTLANKTLITWIHELLKTLDIKTNINKGIATCNKKKFDCWTILISGRDKVEKFAYNIGFDSYKDKILYTGLKCNSPKYKILQNSAKIILSILRGPKDTNELLKENSITKYQIKYSLQRLQKLKIVGKKKKNKYEWNFYLNKKDNNYLSHCTKIAYKKIKEGVYEIPIKQLSIKDYNGYVYDISVEKDSPNFIVEGNILVHNSTRSSILETLYDRGYVKEKSIEATPLGISLIETLEKHSPIIIDENLTKSFEEEMELISQSKSNFQDKEKKVIDKAKDTITKISEQFKKEEKEIGKELLQANIEQREQQKIENKLILCPKCGKGYLAITYSRKTKRFFVACDAYPDCKTTYSLPPNGTLKKTDKLCESCGFPIIMSIRYGKKPWFFCFNTDCETNKQRLEEYRKKEEEENN